MNTGWVQTDSQGAKFICGVQLMNGHASKTTCTDNSDTSKVKVKHSCQTAFKMVGNSIPISQIQWSTLLDKCSGSCFLFSELPSLGIGTCGCSVPCTRNVYEATLSNSLLNMENIKFEILQHEKSGDLLPKHQEALNIAYQVCTIVNLIYPDNMITVLHNRCTQK